jgi:uncharacterized membrane protein YccC
MTVRIPLLLRLPAHVINGVAVALGVGLIQALVTAAGGAAAALPALTGVICSSLADVPVTPNRTWRRVLLAGVIACMVSTLAHFGRPHPAVLGPMIAVVSFISAMALAWGPRAGPISFVGILAFIFTMAAPPTRHMVEILTGAGWTAAGAALYFAWSLAASALLQPRYRTLALAAALGAITQLLRSRANLLDSGPQRDGISTVLQAWIENEARLDERLQLARDLLFVKLDTSPARHQAALLLLTIDLRDTLLASELDTDLLGQDAAGKQVRGVLIASLRAYADALAEMELAVRYERPLVAGTDFRSLLDRIAAEGAFPDGDARSRLLPVLIDRGRHMRDDIAQMQALMRGGPEHLPLAQSELQLFISAEGWPLSALKRHATLRSPVLRHALRIGIALSCAYFIGKALPWASHPAWLVLSVAVVLRGNLEQTLSRRNGRVAGTVLGCLLVLGLSRLGTAWVSAATFLVAIGVAHSFVTTRYMVTAMGATVMALLQAHLANPGAGFAEFERLADTFLGALLAWGFSYVLPSWEQRALPGVVTRVKKALAQLSAEVLRWPDESVSELQLRLARREVYEALGSVAATAQRTGVEPERVRLPLMALAALLRHSHALLAHLASVRVMLTRRSDELDRRDAELALQAAAAEVAQSLDTDQKAAVQAGEATPEQSPELPAQLAGEALMPWLHRRLTLAELAAQRVAGAAQTLQAAPLPAP